MPPAPPPWPTTSRRCFPDESADRLRRRALDVYRSYTRDAIDFLKAVSAGDAGAQQMFEIPPQPLATLKALHAEGRGIILVTGHHGNWEAGSVMMARFLRLPLTIVAMREANPEVNRIRQRIRDLIGVETIEVRQSLDTPLQIRQALSQNRFVALLVDRHVGRDRVAVTFLGRPAWFLRTPIVMSNLTGAPLVPCFIRRIGQRAVRRVARPRGRRAEGCAARRRDPGCRAGDRGPDRGAGARPSRVLVPLLPVLGCAARRLRRPRLTALDGSCFPRRVRPHACGARRAASLRQRRGGGLRHRLAGTRRSTRSSCQMDGTSTFVCTRAARIHWLVRRRARPSPRRS